jgi:hypothetical protein
MYHYADGKGNLYVLQSEDQRRLLFESARSSSATATQSAAREIPLSSSAYMRLISAFSSAIDNKFCHRELCNQETGMITALENGLQRRYILSANSKERSDLEAILCDCMACTDPSLIS